MKIKQIALTKYGIYILSVIIAYIFVILTISLFDNDSAKIKKSIKTTKIAIKKQQEQIVKKEVAILGIKPNYAFTSQGYVIVKDNRPIEVNFSNGFFKFKKIKINESNICSQSIQIINHSKDNYQLTLFDASPLMSLKGLLIKPTKCNSNSECSIYSPNLWTDKLSNGWGYNIMFYDSDSEEHLYRPFPPSGSSLILGETENTYKDIHRLDFKININPAQTQEIGTYESNIYLIIHPKL